MEQVDTGGETSVKDFTTELRKSSTVKLGGSNLRLTKRKLLTTSLGPVVSSFDSSLNLYQFLRCF
jgi:hypothetical protein